MREGVAGSGGREGSCHETIAPGAEGCGKEREGREGGDQGRSKGRRNLEEKGRQETDEEDGRDMRLKLVNQQTSL